MGLYWKLVREEEVAPDWLDNPSMTDVQRYSIASSRAGAIGGVIGGLCSAFGIVLYDNSAMVLLCAAADELFEGGGGPKAVVEAEATVLNRSIPRVDWLSPRGIIAPNRASGRSVMPSRQALIV